MRQTPQRNVDYLLGIIGVENPHIFSPYNAVGGEYENWQDVQETDADRDTADQIGWLLSGMAPDEPADPNEPIYDGHPRRDRKGFGWMVTIRAACLFNMISDEYGKYV
ncbi:MAG: hypothetical protein GY906_24465 [bacterium]|nr:hypothetical protein [bacterium]